MPFHEASMQYCCLVVSGERGSEGGGGRLRSSWFNSDAANFASLQPIVAQTFCLQNTNSLQDFKLRIHRQSSGLFHYLLCTIWQKKIWIFFLNSHWNFVDTDFKFSIIQYTFYCSEFKLFFGIWKVSLLQIFVCFIFIVILFYLIILFKNHIEIFIITYNL